MSIPRVLSCVALTVGFVASGCVVGDAETSFDDELSVPFETMSTGDPEDPSPGSLNMFPPVCFWDHGVQQTYRDLAGGPLVNAQGQLPSMPSLPTNMCRNAALKYLARCVLPTGTSMYDAATGTSYNGWLGVATSWQTQALTTTQKEWVTSCLLQHLNGLGAEIPILLEGQLSGFYQNTTLQSQFPFRDSIVWGNLFDSATPLNPGVATWPAFTAHACYFNDVLQTCFNETRTSDAVKKRLCDQNNALCGIQQIDGNCSTACTWTLGLFGNPSYWNCGNVKSFRTRLKDDTMYSTTVCKP